MPYLKRMGELAPKNAAGGFPPGESPRGTFYRTGAHGFIELVDTATGAVISIQNTPEMIPQTDFIEAEIDGQKVLVQSGFDLARLSGFRKDFPFSKALGDIVVQKMIAGTPLSKMHQIKGLPDLMTISRWRREHKEFDDEIRFARRARAEWERDEALEEAEKAAGVAGEFVAGHKLKVDTLKWAAEKDAPEEYGTKVDVKGQIGVAHIMVDTGIRRPGDPGFKEPKPVVQNPQSNHPPMVGEDVCEVQPSGESVGLAVVSRVVERAIAEKDSGE